VLQPLPEIADFTQDKLRDREQSRAEDDVKENRFQNVVFPVAGNRRQVSVGGGMMPRWRRDGSELFYLAPDQMLMAMPVTSKSGYFDAGRATPLFRTRLQPIGSQITGFGAMYDVTSDGQRILINGPPADLGPPITVVLNWAAGLK
jgi:eukaryotic-like serine/threonine-protein kinase